MTGQAETRFEGSYLGDANKISQGTVLECKICWTPYDPALGDETRQIPPGTPFLALPADWKCPTCDAPKQQFMVTVDDAADTAVSSMPSGAGPAACAPAVSDPLALAAAADMKHKVQRLTAEFREIHSGTMRNGPLSNESLSVEAVGFRAWQGHLLGVLITPWFMNLMLLPGPDDDWSAIRTGAKELIEFPSGTFEFIHMQRIGTGAYKACSLFSPMGEFASQLYATDVARAILIALFDAKNREETEQSKTVRRLRENELAATEAASRTGAGDQPRSDGADAPPEQSRRAFLTGRGVAAPAPADTSP